MRMDCLCLAYTCRRAHAAAKSVRANLDAVERAVFKQLPPSLLDKRAAIRKAAAERLRLIRALLTRFGCEQAAKIRDHSHAMTVIASPPPTTHRLGDLVYRSGHAVAANDRRADATLGYNIPFFLTNFTDRLARPTTNRIHAQPASDYGSPLAIAHVSKAGLYSPVPCKHGAKSCGLEFACAAYTVAGQGATEYSEFWPVADLFVCFLFKRTTAKFGAGSYQAWTRFVPTPFDLRCASGYYGKIE
jgi:hypothetical protein